MQPALLRRHALPAKEGIASCNFEGSRPKTNDSEYLLLQTKKITHQ
jgi:hypothetical protein